MFSGCESERYRTDDGDWKTVYYLYDGLGSVRQIIDERGRVVAEYDYSPFGRDIGAKAGFAKKNVFTYTGREYDRDSGLYFYRARYIMDSRVGRFTTVDPLLRLDGTHIDLHPYGYAENNPVSYVDPPGLSPLIITDPTLPGIITPRPLTQQEQIDVARAVHRIEQDASKYEFRITMFLMQHPHCSESTGINVNDIAGDRFAHHFMLEDHYRACTLEFALRIIKIVMFNLRTDLQHTEFYRAPLLSLKCVQPIDAYTGEYTGNVYFCRSDLRLRETSFGVPGRPSISD